MTVANPAFIAPTVEWSSRILFRDADLLIIDKPAGLAVHPGPRTPRSLEDHLPALAFERRRPPAPAHRLDRDTSGCLALGRTPAALRRLMALFASGSVTKRYLALVDGEPPGDRGLIDLPLVKVSTRADGWRMVPAARGKSAVTDWTALARLSGQRTLIAFAPRTGRTHQLRAHAAAAGWAIVGDPVYGRPAESGMLLHAGALAIPWDEQAPPVGVSAPLPAAFAIAISGQTRGAGGSNASETSSAVASRS